MDRKYRVGIVGCGNIFPMHAYPVDALECCELVAVCDNKEERAQAKAADFGCKYYLDYKEMIDKENLDVLHCCTPHYMHPPITIYALEHGVHVLTEKPMSIDYKDTVAMVEAAERSGMTLGVIFQNRYNPGSQLAKKVLDSGELGKVLGAKMNVTWMRTDEYYSKSDWKGTWDKEGGGVIIDQAIHTFDLMLWLLNDEPEWMDVNIANRTHEIIEVEDSAEGVVKFKSGVLASFYTINYYCTDSDIEIELYCEKGKINITADRGVISFFDGRQMIADKVPGESFAYGDVKGYWGVSHIKQIQAFYESLSKGEQPFINGAEAMKTMKMICSIYESGKQKKRVYY
jgi:UDP-N-acetyl-2-amino-2-deoxyglucuronate dehydrogenase